MILHSELRSTRWPWLTQGWHVVADVQRDEQRQRLAEEWGFVRRPWQLFDISHVTRPADRIVR